MVATAAPPRRYGNDALGRRVEKSVTGATYRYIYSGVETVSVYTSTGTWKQDYVYGPGIDEVLMLEQADVLDWDGDSNTTELSRSWYRANALGSILRVEEPDRTEAVSYRYDPYGEVTITRGGSAQGSDPLGQYVTYTGRWRDEETGLYHYRARAYDPMRGRFMQRDPEGLRTGANLYTYCDSGPASRRDPDGRDWEEASTTVLAIGFSNTVTAKELADAALAAATASGIKGLHNGFGDAYRHCLWSCWMTRKIGRARAQVVGDNHEASGNRNGQPHAEFVMDSYNNRQGRICGAVCNETCHNCCMKKPRNGELSVIPQAQPGSPAPEEERQAYDGAGGESEAHEPEGTPYDKGGAQGNRYGGYAR